MSKNVEKASSKELEEHKKHSVYDFLYCDTRRIGSFLSQFDDSGLLEKVTQKDIVSKDTKRGFSINLGGGATALGTGGSANAGINLTPAMGGSEASERVYDPLWANALTFLDYLSGENLIHRNVEETRIGQFLLVSGSLTILDLSLFKGMWQLPNIKNSIMSSVKTSQSAGHAQDQLNRKSRRAGRQIDRVIAKSEDEIAMEGGLDLVGLFPHSIQARVQTEEKSQIFWTSLKEESLVVNAADLILKHGTVIAGSWNMLGILDAFPDFDKLGNMTGHGLDYITQSAALSDSPFGQMMNTMMPHIRPMLGRPFSAYGITPLLIFREIAQ